MSGPAPAVWQPLADGTALLDVTCAGMVDRDFSAPSLLPGWSRAHVLTHLARNADAVARLAQWAATGIETRMYPSREVRDQQIHEGAARPPASIRADVRSSAAKLDATFAAMRGGDWEAELVGATGGPLPARDLPALRAREVWVHLVDLDYGIAFTDLPASLAGAVLDEVVAAMSLRDDMPTLLLTAHDHGTQYRLGSPTETPTHISGAAADLLGWLTGRDRGDGLSGTDRPPLPRWL